MLCLAYMGNGTILYLEDFENRRPCAVAQAARPKDGPARWDADVGRVDGTRAKELRLDATPGANPSVNFATLVQLG